MAERAEALAQIARMLGEAGPRPVDAATARAAAAAAPERLESALLEEAAASDDVSDQASALAYLERRLEFLAVVLDPETLTRLRAGLGERVGRW